jgi:rSAM/selenodomain-associated transferase 2
VSIQHGVEAAVKVSIVVPALDEAAGIGAVLRALQPFRKEGAELILVDGGSRDGTERIAAPLVDRLVSGYRGRARQMNAGAQVAKGEVLWFLHADTLAPPRALSAIRASLSRGRRCWGRYDVRFSGSHPLLRVVAASMNLRSRLTGIATGDQGIFVVRDVFLEIGGFPEIPLMEDIEISRRLKRRSWPICLSEALTTSSRRWEVGGLVRTIALMWWLRLAYFFGADPGRLVSHYREKEGSR